jgi:hypothetical protein
VRVCVCVCVCVCVSKLHVCMSLLQANERASLAVHVFDPNSTPALKHVHSVRRCTALCWDVLTTVLMACFRIYAFALMLSH